MSTQININKNIYNSDGTLTTNRKVDLDNKTIDFNNGNVGINTPIPTQKLEVTGNTKLNGTLSINDSSSTLNVVGNAFGQASLITPTGALILTAGYGGVNINGANPNLQIDGKTTTSQFQLTTTPTAGYVLTSDASGNGTWALIVPSVQSVTSASSVTPVSTNDLVKITAQAAALALANPTGTWNEGQPLMIRIKDNGTARAITWDTNYRAIGITLPTTTVLSKTTYVGIIYNSTDGKWDAIGVTTQA